MFAHESISFLLHPPCFYSHLINKLTILKLQILNLPDEESGFRFAQQTSNFKPQTSILICPTNDSKQLKAVSAVHR